jgi:hypothetical protein
VDQCFGDCALSIWVCDLHVYLEVEKGLWPLCPTISMGDQEGWRGNLLVAFGFWWPGLPGELRAFLIGCWWHPRGSVPESRDGLRPGAGRRSLLPWLPLRGDEVGELSSLGFAEFHGKTMYYEYNYTINTLICQYIMTLNKEKRPVFSTSLQEEGVDIHRIT